MTDVSRIQNYLIGALSTGNTMYMPKIPLKPKEAEALALYLASLADPTVVAKFVDEKTRAAEAEAVKAAPNKPVAVSMANPLHTGSKE
jgi:hypothetical protein